jgi:hypothetical protein
MPPNVALSPREDEPMSMVATPDRFTTLPDEQVIASAVTALEEHGFSVEVEIHQELPGRIHIVLIRQVVGF